MTPEDVAADVIDTGEMWLDGYTDPHPVTGVQYRTEVVSRADDDTSFVITYGENRYSDEGRRYFRVRLTVEEVPEWTAPKP